MEFPRFPIATHTFRANPARPARPAPRIADPRLKASHASGAKAISSRSTSDGTSVPGWTGRPPGPGNVSAETSDPARGSTPTGRSPGPRAA